MKTNSQEEHIESIDELLFNEVPENWLSLPLKRIVKPRITDGPHETPDWVSQGIPFVSAEGIENGTINFANIRGFITSEQHTIYSKKCLPKRSDIFIVKSGSTTGKIGYVETDIEFNIWSPLALVRTNPKYCAPRFLYYALCSKPFQTQVQVSWSFGTQPNIGMGVIENLRVFVPSLEQQKSIAHFLDRKTAAIDTLIAKKQRLIQLLEEKRTALINQAVTKGLNPNAPMKDSGIPWIGDIPEHWNVKKLKWLCPYIMVGIVITPAKYYVEFGIPCLRSLNIRPGEIIGENLVYISEESNELLSKSKIFTGDLVCVRTGQPGVTAVVNDRFNNANCIDLIIIRKSAKALSEYVSFMMNSEVCRFQYLMGTSGSIQQHFNIETATNLIVCNPPLDEQLKIVERCYQIIGKHKFTIQKTSEQIEKLQEYRRSLITAAVTGKLAIEEAANV